MYNVYISDHPEDSHPYSTFEKAWVQASALAMLTGEQVQLDPPEGRPIIFIDDDVLMPVTYTEAKKFLENNS